MSGTLALVSSRELCLSTLHVVDMAVIGTQGASWLQTDQNNVRSPRLLCSCSVVTWRFDDFFSFRGH